jgi:hypothetical protein
MNVNVRTQLVNPVTGERGVVRVVPNSDNGRTLVAALLVRRLPC